MSGSVLGTINILFLYFDTEHWHGYETMLK